MEATMGFREEEAEWVTVWERRMQSERGSYYI